MATTSAAKVVSSASFLNSIGVNVHMGFLDTAYKNEALVVNSLNYLGVDHVRDAVPYSWGASHWEKLAANGIKFDLVVTAYTGGVDLTGSMAMIDALVKKYPGSITAIEGANEVLARPVSYEGKTTIASEIKLQHDIYVAVHGDANLAGVAVYNMTGGGNIVAQYQQFGDLSASTDYASSHIYFPFGASPMTFWGQQLSLAQVIAPGDKNVVTETGYFTMPSDPTGVSEVVQAKYTLDLLFDAINSGVEQTYLYELLDQKPDPNGTNRQMHYGLFNNDGTPKLAATAIHNLNAILEDHNPGVATQVSASDVTVKNMTSVDNKIILQKSNGVYDIVLWSEPQIWDSKNHKEIAVASHRVTVDLATAADTISVYDPLLGSGAIVTYHNVSHIEVTLTDHPLIIEVTKAGPVVTHVAPSFDAHASSQSADLAAATLYTNSTNYKLTGHGTANTKLAISDGLVKLADVTTAADGSWSYTATGLSEGGHSFSVVDQVSGTPSSVLNLVTDYHAAAKPVITSFLQDSGRVGDFLTNVNQLTLTGNAEAGGIVRVYDGATQIGTAVADDNGQWSLTTPRLADARHAFTADVVDQAGNVSTRSVAYTITVDTVAPGAASVVSFSPDRAIVGDGITNADKIVLSGFAQANSTIAVFDGAVQVGQAYADASGKWGFVTATLSDGVHGFSAMAVDAAGNSGALSQSLRVTIDTHASAAPVFNSLGQNNYPVGSDLTNVNKLVLSGTATAFETIKIFDGAVRIGSVTADAAGSWSFKTATLVDGSHAFSASSTDAAGNESARSNLDTVVIDAHAAAAPTFSVASSAGTGIAAGGATASSKLVISGAAEANTNVSVFDGKIKVGDAHVDASGHWSLATDALAEGSHSLTAVDTDLAGNVSVASRAFGLTVDTMAPNVTIQNIMQVGSAYTLTGTAEARSLIDVHDAFGHDLGTATTDTRGNWSFKVTDTTTGVHSFTAIASDKAGNTSASGSTASLGTTTADTLSAAGDAVLKGGFGSDNFVFSSNLGKQTVLDFQATGVGHDVLTFDHAVFRDLSDVLAHTTQVGADVVIAADHGSVTLSHVLLQTLTQNDFMFT